MSGSAEWPGSLVKSLLSMAAQKPSHSRTKLLLEMPPGMAMSLYRSLQGNCAVTKGGDCKNMRHASLHGKRALVPCSAGDPCHPWSHTAVYPVPDGSFASCDGDYAPFWDLLTSMGRPGHESPPEGVLRQAALDSCGVPAEREEGCRCLVGCP